MADVNSKPSAGVKACANCVYYRKSPMQMAQGACHRHPPQIVAGGKGVGGFFPPVKDGDFCGDFVDAAGVKP